MIRVSFRDRVNTNLNLTPTLTLTPSQNGITTTNSRRTKKIRNYFLLSLLEVELILTTFQLLLKWKYFVLLQLSFEVDSLVSRFSTTLTISGHLQLQVRFGTKL